MTGRWEGRWGGAAAGATKEGDAEEVGRRAAGRESVGGRVVQEEVQVVEEAKERTGPLGRRVNNAPANLMRGILVQRGQETGRLGLDCLGCEGNCANRGKGGQPGWQQPRQQS